MIKFRPVAWLLMNLFPLFLMAETDSVNHLSAKADVTEITGNNVICEGDLVVLNVAAKSSLTPNNCRWFIQNDSERDIAYAYPLEFRSSDYAGDTILVSVKIYDASNHLLDSAIRPIYVTTKPYTLRDNDTFCPEEDREATLAMHTDAQYFLWNQGGTVDSINVWHFPPVDTFYTVKVSYYPVNARFYDSQLGTYVQFDNVCYTEDSAQIVVKDSVKFPITGDTVACVGTTITLQLHDGRNVIWLDRSETAPTIEPEILDSGNITFYAIATNSEGCRDTAAFTVRGVLTPSEAVVFAENDTICRGATTRLHVSGGASYRWSLMQKTDSVVEVSPGAETTYEVIVYAGENQSSCTVTREIAIYVQNCDMIYFPSAISLSSHIPENRIFKPIGIPQSFNEYYLAIFNRWGQLIFESDNFEVGWNGTHQGENVRPGAYVYLFRLKNKYLNWEKTGTVTVIH